MRSARYVARCLVCHRTQGEALVLGDWVWYRQARELRTGRVAFVGTVEHFRNAPQLLVTIDQDELSERGSEVVILGIVLDQEGGMVTLRLGLLLWCTHTLFLVRGQL